MFINWNDYELLYLIKEGIVAAKTELYRKYSFLISKKYYQNQVSFKLSYQDYFQECLMALERAIYFFDTNSSASFFAYFSTVLWHKTLNICRLSSMHLNDDCVSYLKKEVPSPVSSHLVALIQKELEKENDRMSLIFKECVIETFSIRNFCRKYQLDYNQTYRLYKKMLVKIEKILTNCQ